MDKSSFLTLIVALFVIIAISIIVCSVVVYNHFKKKDGHIKISNEIGNDTSDRLEEIKAAEKNVLFRVKRSDDNYASGMNGYFVDMQDALKQKYRTLIDTGASNCNFSPSVVINNAKVTRTAVDNYVIDGKRTCLEKRVEGVSDVFIIDKDGNKVMIKPKYFCLCA